MAPRRDKPHPIGKKIGARIRELRREGGLTQEDLAWETNLGSKGYLSDVEHGLVLPSVEKLSKVAKQLEVEMFDLLVCPEADERHQLVDATRELSPAQVRKALKFIKAL